MVRLALQDYDFVKISDWEAMQVRPEDDVLIERN
jgi:hypothetical protein